MNRMDSVPMERTESGHTMHARAGSSGSLPGLSTNRTDLAGGVVDADMEQQEPLLDGKGAAAPLNEPPPPPPPPGLVTRLRRCLPSASGVVTCGFAALLIYLTVARKCNDGGWPEACRLMHLHSNIDWVTIRKSGPRDPTRCNQVLDFPRVALMFLSAGSLHHEDTWRDWLQDAGGIVPQEQLKAHGCDDKKLRRLQRACGIRITAKPLDRQYLFSVYSHPSATFKGHPKNSVFKGTEIAHRLPTAHGAPALMDAIRGLLKAALANHHNQQFLLLSESEVPLYPAAVVWRQLIGESKSRINACKGKHMDGDQWPDWAPTDSIMQHKDWRKSPAWFGLRRKHAELAIADARYLAVMQDHCKSKTERDKKRCFLDEHYIPSLLAFHGLDDETDCRGGLVTANWTSAKSAHPREYKPSEVSIKLFKRLRADVYFGRRLDWHGCKSDEAIKRGVASFVRADEATHRSCHGRHKWNSRLLKYKCPLFARKFKNDTATAVHDALIDCESGLGILDLGDGCN